MSHCSFRIIKAILLPSGDHAGNSYPQREREFSFFIRSIRVHHPQMVLTLLLPYTMRCPSETMLEHIIPIVFR